MTRDGASLRYLSVCSGIEAASVAWHDIGWTPAGFAEIEPFPAAVLAHRFPSVPNLGDMTNFKEWNVGKIDLLVGGTPCQAFSVAGLRRGLEDARGNLTLTFCEMADHFDPEWIVWENVPGVLSSQDNAFGCFLGALCGGGEPLVPERRWDNAGVVSGPRRTVAWRVLDAQYFGVAQRRRRVFVCAVRGSGNWAAAAALFPVADGLFWDSPPSREARQSLAPTIAGCANGGGANGPGRDVDSVESLQIAHAFKVRGGCDGGGKGYLGSDEVAFTLSTLQDQTIAARMVAFGEYVDDGTASAMKARDYKDATDLVAQPIGFNARQDPDTWQGRTGPLDTDGSTQAVATAMQVRRLTPTECERLQGFPDGWTAIPWRKSTESNCPDGPRYKALGNSMAVPVMRWIGKRIQMVTQL